MTDSTKKTTTSKTLLTVLAILGAFAGGAGAHKVLAPAPPPTVPDVPPAKPAPQLPPPPQPEVPSAGAGVSPAPSTPPIDQDSPLWRGPKTEPALAPAFHGGVQTFTGQDNEAYREYAARIPQAGTFTRTWSKYLALPSEGQLQAVKGRVALGAQVLLQLTATPEGLAKEEYSKTPVDVAAWAQQAGKVIDAYVAAGITPYAVSLWNEPDLPDHWAGTAEEFYAFYTQALPLLQKRYPQLRIGGPSVARIGGSASKWWEGLFLACQKAKAYPQYLGVHMYQGLATDLDRCQVGTRLRALYETKTLASAEGVPIVLDEWNWGVPGGHPMPQNDGPPAAANYVATILSLAPGGFNGQTFFMLNDGSWDSRSDFAGLSCGIFTVHNAPKALWAGIRLAAEVIGFGEHELVPDSTIPISCTMYVARNAAGVRKVLVANSPRLDDTSVNRYLDSRGIDLEQYKGQEPVIERWIHGAVPYATTGLPEWEQTSWEQARQVQVQAEVLAASPATIKLELKTPASKGMHLVVIDATHGNPVATCKVADSPFTSAFNDYLSQRSSLGALLDDPTANAVEVDPTGILSVSGTHVLITLPPNTVAAFTLYP